VEGWKGRNHLPTLARQPAAGDDYQRSAREPKDHPTPVGLYRGLDTIVVPSEAHALTRSQPDQGNGLDSTSSRDDKSPVYIKVTLQELLAGLRDEARLEDDGARYFSARMDVAPCVALNVGSESHGAEIVTMICRRDAGAGPASTSYSLHQALQGAVHLANSSTTIARDDRRSGVVSITDEVVRRVKEAGRIPTAA